MCGIAGFLDLARIRPAEELLAIASAMGQRIRHRGPDEGDAWADQAAGVALSHRRLSIVDLSPAGHQPMHSASGRFVVAFNGEIYNFPSLRSELEALGHSFRGHSDTEVLLAAAEEWGLPAALPRFNGMFALALWDRQRRSLTLARDRFGEKPLYYGRVGEALIFASELKALRAFPGFSPTVDRASLEGFLQFGYVPEPGCIYQGFQRVPAGASLTFECAGLSMPSPEVYWSLRAVAESGMSNPYVGTSDDAINELEHILLDSVRLRMYADVPLGAFLSGGIDSSTVVALMQEQASRPVKTFTIGFREDGFDEAQHAAAVARHLGTEHTELYLSAEDSLAVVPRLPSLYDEPFADPSQIPTFLVAQLARSRVTVSLSGDAGDEFFGGYSRYAIARDLWQRIHRIPRSVRNLVSALLRNWPGLAAGLYRATTFLLPGSLRFSHPRDKATRLAEILASDSAERLYLGLVSLWKEPSQVALDVPGLAATAWKGIPFQGETLTEAMMLWDALSYLPGDILTKVDRASMGVGLEARVPLLDPRVAEFAWRLPAGFRTQGGQGKWVLRKVLHRRVPASLVERPKMGFGVPIGAWLRGPLREWASDLLAPERVRRQGFFDASRVSASLTAHLSGRTEDPYRIWALLMFQAWLCALETEGA